MTAQTAIPPISSKSETKPATPAMAAEKPMSAPQRRAYWGDRLTIRFWLFCVAAMWGMLMVEAVHRFVLSLSGSPSSPP